MKYKNLKLRVILPSILVVIIAVMVVAFFTGGLEAGALSKDNIKWTEEGFISPVSQIENGNVKWYLGTDEKGEKLPINTRKLVAEKGNYRMYLNEDTTVVTVAEYLGKDENGDDIERVMYTTANDSADSPDEKSNLTLYYYDSNGKLGNGFNSFEKSVNYENRVQGRNEKRYSVRYNEDGTLDILYQIGEFANIYEVLPKFYSKADFEDVFIGNTFFMYTSKTNYSDVEVVGENGTKAAKEIKIDPKNGGFGYCLDNEAALYILKNGLAGSIEYEYKDVNAKPSGGDDLLKFTSVPSDESQILDQVGGIWRLYDTLDENGNFKFKFGENCNSGSSPVKVNPFLTASIIDTNISSPTYYPVKYDVIDENGEKVIKDSFWYDRLNHEEGYHKFNANTILTSQDLYKWLVVGQYSYLDTDQEIYSYLQDTTDENNAGKLKVLNSNYENIDGVDVYFDYNCDGVITEDERYAVGGYQGRDLQGNYLFIDENYNVFYFDENGDTVLNDENGVAKPVQVTGSYKPYNAGLTKDMVAEQNNKYNVGSEASSVAFQIALRFVLTETGIEVNIINDSIEEGKGKDNSDTSIPSYLRHDSKVAKVEICKYLTTNKSSTDVGSIIIPDGSGAVISFNSVKDKQFVGKYTEKFIYGNDTAINREEAGHSIQDIMLPMYAFIEDGALTAGKTSRGVAAIAIVEKGAAQTSISADFKRSSATSGISLYNHAYFTTYFRSSENVKITSSSNYMKISEKLYDGDIKYVYRFITSEGLEKQDGEPINYVDIANNYREYLINYYQLQDKKDSTKVATPTITFVGAYEKKTIKLGVVYNKEYSLTTFEEAGKIIDELTNKGLSSMNVTYTLWTNNEKYNKISDEFKVSKVLGGKSDLADLNEKLSNYKYNFFLDYVVTTGYGYEYSFGALKFNAKSISGSQSNALTYVLSTGLADAQGKVGGRLSPVFYNSLVSKFMKNYGDLNINGINIKDLGNKNTSDYSKDRTVYSADGLEYQVQSLKTAYESGKKVMLDAPYDYAFKYLDVANNVPVETTLYPIVDYSIPFYQLVVSGLFDYTAPTINSGNDYSVEWNLLKAIETGSNIGFEVSASDTINLLDTEYTSYYNSYFSNWEDKILSMNETLNKSGIYESRLVNHEFLTDTLVRVTYENGLTILINYSNNNYRGETFTVRANSFAIVNAGKGA